MIKRKKKKIAFIYEGAKTEKELFQNLTQIFFSEKADVSIISFPAEGNIYMLWTRLKKDRFETGVIEVIKEMSFEARQILSDNTEDDFSEIYMFFDYDGHNNNIPKEYTGKDILCEMLETFNNETEYGKLYISYPMIESLKEISVNSKTYKNFYMPLYDIRNYKEISGGKTDFKNFNNITRDMWYIACNASRKRASLIVLYRENCTYKEFLEKLEQYNIYMEQKEKFIKMNYMIAILNSVPLFLIEYYGENLWNII
ncbi:MAG: hypothetical protein K1W24_12700 [Lachnospiraceae bacterium]